MNAMKHSSIERTLLLGRKLDHYPEKSFKYMQKRYVYILLIFNLSTYIVFIQFI